MSKVSNLAASFAATKGLTFVAAPDNFLNEIQSRFRVIWKSSWAEWFDYDLFSHPKSSGLRNGRTETEFRHKTLKIGALHIFNKRFPRWWNSMHVWERRMALPILLYPIQAALYGTCLCCPLCHSSMPKRSKWLDHAKFCSHRSRRCGHMAVFRFSRWRPSAILDF